jgi:hypothetical protein
MSTMAEFRYCNANVIPFLRFSFGVPFTFVCFSFFFLLSGLSEMFVSCLRGRTGVPSISSAMLIQVLWYAYWQCVYVLSRHTF